MRIRTLYVNEGQAFSVTERLEYQDGTLVQPGDIAYTSLCVFAGHDPEPLCEVDDLGDAGTIYATPQLDGLWTRDSTGYTFKHDVSVLDTEEYFTAGGRVYRLEYRFERINPDDGFLLLPVRVSVRTFLTPNPGT